MNIFDVLGGVSNFSFCYHGVNDISTSWDVKTIIDNKVRIIQYYEGASGNSNASLDSLIDYLFLKKTVSMHEIIPLLNREEDKTTLTAMLETLNPIFTSMSLGCIINYLNANISAVFEKQDQMHDIIEATLEICVKCQNGLADEFFLYLIKEHSYLVYFHYEDFQSTFVKRTHLLSALLSTEGVQKAIDTNLDEITSIIISVENRHSSELSQCTGGAIDAIVNHGNSLADNLSLDNVMYYDSTIHKIFTFLKTLNDIRTVQYEEHVKKSEALLSQYLIERGHKREFRIPAEEIEKILRADGPWFNKLLQLTHTKDPATQEIIPSLNQPPEKGHALADLATTNIPTNDYFTFSHQKMLSITLHVGTVANHIIMTDEKLFNNCATWTLGYWDYIQSKLGCMEPEVEDDIKLLFQMLQNLFGLPKNTAAEVAQSLCYGPCMFICALTEKIMRITYKCLLKDDVYVSLDKATMGNMLSDGNDLFIKILGEHQVKNLRFYFCSDGDTRVGYDFRNKLAHWNGIQSTSLSPFFVCELLYLFYCVLTSFFSFFAKDEIAEQPERTEDECSKTK